MVPAGGDVRKRQAHGQRAGDPLMTQHPQLEESGGRERSLRRHEGKRRRRGSAVLIGVLGLLFLVLAAGRAWACVPQPFIFLEPVSSGPPGSEVTVQGLRFGEPDIEIRWQTPDGPTLATATGGDFSVLVTIPEAPPGLYALLVIARAPGGGIDSVQRAVFQVTEEGSSGVSQGLPEESAGEGHGASSVPVPSPSPLPTPVGDFAVLAAAGAGLLALGALCGIKLARRSEAAARRGEDDPRPER